MPDRCKAVIEANGMHTAGFHLGDALNITADVYHYVGSAEPHCICSRFSVLQCEVCILGRLSILG